MKKSAGSVCLCHISIIKIEQIEVPSESHNNDGGIKSMHNRNIIMNKEINFTLLNMVHVHIEHVMVIGNKNTLTAD